MGGNRNDGHYVIAESNERGGGSAVLRAPSAFTAAARMSSSGEEDGAVI